MSWREKRIHRLTELVATGAYEVPPIEVAHAILFGEASLG